MNKQLISVLAQVFNLRDDQIVVELSQENLGNWDSLKQMDLVISLEREFNITLEIQEIIKMTTVGNIIDVLANKGVSIGA